MFCNRMACDIVLIYCSITSDRPWQGEGNVLS